MTWGLTILGVLIAVGASVAALWLGFKRQSKDDYTGDVDPEP